MKGALALLGLLGDCAAPQVRVEQMLATASGWKLFFSSRQSGRGTTERLSGLRAGVRKGEAETRGVVGLFFGGG